MTGEELYLKLSIRDYSNSDSDIYAQDLQTYFFHSVTSNTIADFFKLLEMAHFLDKKIILKSENLESD
ncbi:hypothetical protein [Epilithonimonas hispanica]|uniref:Uncharacterized protein n=1 Tax=Epilithonimonas hispanica TaxID=358687 RepID=A0A3D9CIQ5_9FLAO|nr:hypothetical protein [Epilithonimonas hispanica]REC65642.1 hypothetical protein DRF58_17810 [Epilithonimonas hispanica]